MVVRIASLVVISLLASSLALQLLVAEEGGGKSQPGPFHPVGGQPIDDDTTSTQLLREGTQIEDVIGKFEVIGDRILFYPSEADEPLRALENLALERIALQLSGLSRQRVWRVTGTVTEFQGGNYLLVERATLKASPDR